MAEEAPQRTREEEMYTLGYMQQVYQSQYNTVVNDMNRSVQYLNDLNAAQKSLESSDMIGGKDTLVSLGGGVYITSKTKKLDTVIVGVGAGYLMEKNAEEAKKFVADKIEKVTEVFNRLVKSRNELREAIIDVTYRLDELNRK